MILKVIKDRHEPLVSIITITYNSEKTITDTIESVLNQTYKNIEYIIVDGSSSDKTISIINSYKDNLKESCVSFKFLSEDDNGIADAWNKGIILSTGDIIGMLNSDDWYDENAVGSVVNCIDVQKPELTYGICKRVNEKKEEVEVMNRVFNPKKIYLNFGFSFTTCFVTKKLYEEIGNYNINYKIAIDTDFLLRSFNQGVSFKRCSNITYMRLGGVSTKFKRAALKEHQRALKENGFNTMIVFLFGIVKKGILLYQKLK